MRLVLLSGGSGKRLWPMSNDNRSKQFLKVLKNEVGTSVSMLQRVWAQLEDAGLQEYSYICASKAQHDMIESQIGQVEMIDEPCRRDTFPAIALSALYLSDVAGCPDDEPMVVLPVDPFVNDTYFQSVRHLGEILLKSEADIALMGVTPTEGNTKFGYVRVQGDVVHQSHLTWQPVDSFVEKPSTDVAKKLISEGALWNCGVFCFKVGFLKQQLSQRGYPTSYEALLALFNTLPKKSFDYEILERTKHIVVTPYHGEWDDLGTWAALSGKITDPFIGQGNAVACEETHVINELAIPIVAMGLHNAMVVSTPDGILVANKAEASAIKDVITDYSSRPMFEERRWGWYRVLDYQKLPDGTEVLTKSNELLPGHHISYQKHLKRSEVWTILQGSGEFVLESKIVTVAAGDVIRVYPGQWHALRAKEKLTFVEVQFGSELVEEDVIRRYLDWNDILQHCLVLV